MWKMTTLFVLVTHLREYICIFGVEPAHRWLKTFHSAVSRMMRGRQPTID